MRLTEVNGILAGVLASLCLLRGQLPAQCQHLGEDGTAAASNAPCQRIVLPEFTTHLGIQYLNTGLPALAALQVHSAALDASGSARFRIWALTDDPRFCSAVTYDYQRSSQFPNDGRLRVRLHPGQHSVGRRTAVRLVDDPAGAYLEFMPIRELAPRDQSLTFSFTPRRVRQTFTARFDLSIPGVLTQTRAKLPLDDGSSFALLTPSALAEAP